MLTKQLISNEALDKLLAQSPSPRVTKEYINSRITDVKFHKLGATLTHCTIHLDNKYQVTGESACVNPENYNKEIDEKISHDNAYGKLWSLFGFLLAEKNKLGSDSNAENAA